MSVTVTKTATLVDTSENWTDFLPGPLDRMDSWLAACRLGDNSSPKWGTGRGFGFSVPLDATIIGISTQAYWWGSNAGSYITLSFFGVNAYDTGAVSGRWVSGSTNSGLPTPAQVNAPGASFMVGVGRTTVAPVNVFIDQLTVSVTYEPYVAPPPPPPPGGGTYLPSVGVYAVSDIKSCSAVGGGVIQYDGLLPIIDHGLFWSLGGPRVGQIGVDGGDVGVPFALPIAGLTPGVRYLVAVYAGNANGYGISDPVEFVTAPQKAGDGGLGYVSSISGQSTGYAGGGGGGMFGVAVMGPNATHGGATGGSQDWNGNAGVINTGGGGGGAGTGRAGGAGGSGVVVIRYKTADAIATSPSLSTSIFRPSIAYRAGRLFAPYSVGEDAQILTITGNTLASPTVVGTSAAHRILAATAQVVVISGSNSTPSIDGSYVATRVDDTHFSIPVNVTTAGTAGLVLYNHSVGWALTAGGYNDIGWLTQSPTTFHTGSMKKDFRYISVSHDVLPDGATVRPMSWLIDGVYGTTDGVAYSPQETRYSIDRQGYSIETTLGMTPDYTKSISPLIHGINVIWNFVKNKKHTYSLDCRSGANAGRWNENPETALKFLYATANERATFEDRFAGVYQGAIESVEFTPAQVSLSEGPSGLCKIVVREEQ